MCVPLGIHLEPNKKRDNAVSDIVIIINCAICLRVNCVVPNKEHFGPMVHPMSLSKNIHTLI